MLASRAFCSAFSRCLSTSCVYVFVEVVGTKVDDRDGVVEMKCAAGKY